MQLLHLESGSDWHRILQYLICNPSCNCRTLARGQSARYRKENIGIRISAVSLLPCRSWRTCNLDEIRWRWLTCRRRRRDEAVATRGESGLRVAACPENGEGRTWMPLHGDYARWSVSKWYWYEVTMSTVVRCLRSLYDINPVHLPNQRY